MKFSYFSTPEKEFCCLKMKDVLQAIVYEETKNLTIEERINYSRSNRENGRLSRFYKNKII